MASRDSKKRKAAQPVSAKSKQAYSIITNTQDIDIPTGIEAPAEIVSPLNLWGSDSTAMPDFEVEGEGQEPYAQTVPEMADKYLFSRGFEPRVIIPLIIIGILFVDNWKDKLDTTEQLIWSVKKCGVFIGLYLSFILVSKVYRMRGMVSRWIKKLFRSRRL